MARRRKLNKHAQKPDQSSLQHEDPPFLRLPAELRNAIYELAVTNETSISLRVDRVLYCPPLSLVNRQIRTEYKQIYLDEAPRRARHVNVHITDFVHPKADRGHLLDLPDDFPATRPYTGPPGDWAKRLEYQRMLRTYRIRIFLTNSWKVADFEEFLLGHNLRPNFTIMRPFVGRLHSNSNLRYSCSIHFDPATFDTTRCRRILPPVVFHKSGYGEIPSRYTNPLTMQLQTGASGRQRDCYYVLRAFKDAFKRCTPEIMDLGQGAEEKAIAEAIEQGKQENAAEGKISREMRSQAREKRRAEMELDGKPKKASRSRCG